MFAIAIIRELRWHGADSLATNLSRGDRTTAIADVERLARNVPPYDRGDRTANRASIFALLGEHARAVELLQQAHAEGASFLSSAFHARIGLEPLRGFDPFEEFVRPK